MHHMSFINVPHLISTQTLHFIRRKEVFQRVYFVLLAVIVKKAENHHVMINRISIYDLALVEPCFVEISAALSSDGQPIPAGLPFSLSYTKGKPSMDSPVAT
jgi:hypothetical protein